MPKQLIPLIISVCAAAFLTVACQTIDPEEPQIPETEEPVAVPERATIPFSLNISTEETKVSYAGGTYQFKEGDRMYVSGIDQTDNGGDDRTDIYGYLDKSGDVWSGNLTYLVVKGVPTNDTPLEVTLVNAGNTDVSKNGSAILPGGVGDSAALLLDAVEKYSLFTVQTTFGATSAILLQQATFLDVTVTFDFDGSREVEAGQALVDLNTTRGQDLKLSQFYPVDEKNEDFYVHFMAVVPGGQKVSDFNLTVGDRAVTFSNANLELATNTKYTVSRTVVYGPQLGDPFWSDGTYGRLQHASTEGVSIVGIIVYVNHDYTPGTDAANIDDAITEKSAGFGHGLVMALNNVSTGSGDMWGTGSNLGGARWCLSAGNGVQRTSTLVTKPSETLGVAALNGLANTNAIVDALGENSAAYLAQHYAAAPANTTGWFLPSIGQWIYTISVDGFGGADHASNWQSNDGKNWLKRGSLNDLVRVMNNNGSTDNLLVKSLNDRLQALQNDYDKTIFAFSYDEFGWSVGSDYGDNYWTSSEYDASNAFRMNLGSVETDKNGNKYSTIKVKQESKINYNTWKDRFIMRIRPFLAF